MDLLRKECISFEKPRQISMRLLDVARKLVDLYASSQLGPTTEILHARLLAVAIKSAKGVNDDERRKLLEQWERVTFRIFGLFDKDCFRDDPRMIRLRFVNAIGEFQESYIEPNLIHQQEPCEARVSSIISSGARCRTGFPRPL